MRAPFSSWNEQPEDTKQLLTPIGRLANSLWEERMPVSKTNWRFRAEA